MAPTGGAALLASGRTGILRTLTCETVRRPAADRDGRDRDMAAPCCFAHHGAKVHTRSKLGLLASLYFSQGLPFGFFSQALPVLLRKDGVSLAVVGSTSLLALPWMLKFLWAPLVDRYGSARFGARRGWILPMQAASVALLLAVSRLAPAGHLPLLFVAVLFANLLAATQDIATDALAIDLLGPEERGLGNGVQVAGYRVGMIVGGGLLLLVYDQLGWTSTFVALAALLALASLPVWLHREPSRVQREAARVDFRAIYRALSRPDVRRFLPVLVTYKVGDAFGTSMLRPFLVDRGQSLGRIGFTLGTLGFVAGLCGALAGGALCSRLSRRTALLSFALLHALSVGTYGLCALGVAGESALLAFIVIEHFAGGMATAALFTCMMDHAAPDSAATDYTVQASLVLAAGGFVALPSGFIAERVGYGVHFALALSLGLASAVVVRLCVPAATGAGAQ
jgi:PAT family beta-lactamase induction signal transducer AmpG